MASSSRTGALRIGLVFCGLYTVVAVLLAGHPVAARYFGDTAVYFAPALFTWVVLRRRADWSGCQWLFWATFLLGVVLWSLGQVGWTLDEIVFGHQLPWLQWHSVLQLFGSMAPLLALLARPQKGTRDADVPALALDIVAVAIVAGFLYSFFVVLPGMVAAERGHAMLALEVFVSVQRPVLLLALLWSVWDARHTVWQSTYWRLAFAVALGVGFRTLSLRAVAEGTYRSGSVYDLAWLLPLVLYAWAAEQSPASDASAADAGQPSASRGQPYLIFASLVVVPIVAYGAELAWPLVGPLAGVRALSAGVTMVSMLALLMGRFAVQRLALKQAGTRLRLLAKSLEQTDSLVLIQRNDSRFEYANEAFCRTFRYQPEQLRTMPLKALFAESARHVGEELTAAALTRGSAKGTVLRQRSDGTTFFTACNVVPLFDAAGSLTHFVWVERDVTDDLRVREQLIQSERLSAVGQLVAGVAHEINNPLQSIIGLTELLLASPQEPAIRADVDRVRDAAMRAGRIVRNLLAFVRKSPRERELADLNEIVESTVALRAYELREARIEIEEDYFPDLPPVNVNREEIQQIVLNLLLNAEHAIQVSGHGGSVRLRTGLSNGAVLLEVRDDGPGVPSELAGRIFEPFFTTKGVGKGTGLGLSIAFGIAGAHGGSLDLMPSSSGACFRLTLPLVRAAVGAGGRVA